MTIQEIIACGGSAFLILITLIQISPIKFDPWSMLAKTIGKAINSEVLKELEELKKVQRQTQNRLSEHIRVDNEHNADKNRANILRFNNELLREIPHTREEFIEILSDIDHYENYCNAHPGYKNNRASHAISNIGRVYDERLKNHDFL